MDHVSLASGSAPFKQAALQHWPSLVADDTDYFVVYLEWWEERDEKTSANLTVSWGQNSSDEKDSIASRRHCAAKTV